LLKPGFTGDLGSGVEAAELLALVVLPSSRLFFQASRRSRAMRFFSSSDTGAGESESGGGVLVNGQSARGLTVDTVATRVAITVIAAASIAVAVISPAVAVAVVVAVVVVSSAVTITLAVSVSAVVPTVVPAPLVAIALTVTVTVTIAVTFGLAHAHGPSRIGHRRANGGPGRSHGRLGGESRESRSSRRSRPDFDGEGFDTNSGVRSGAARESGTYEGARHLVCGLPHAP
jgi:hypothetical protein